MAQRPINCGKFWTCLSTECWIRGKNCGECPYQRYCWVDRMQHDKPIIKIVIETLLVKYGKPPEKLILLARESMQNPIFIYKLKKNSF